MLCGSRALGSSDVVFPLNKHLPFAILGEMRYAAHSEEESMLALKLREASEVGFCAEKLQPRVGDDECNVILTPPSPQLATYMRHARLRNCKIVCWRNFLVVDDTQLVRVRVKIFRTAATQAVYEVPVRQRLEGLG